MKCSKGISARIIMSLRPENIGKIVTVESYIGYLTKDQTFEFRGIVSVAMISDNYWWVAVNSNTELQNMFGGSPKAYIPDTWLEPIIKKSVTTSTTENVDVLA